MTDRLKSEGFIVDAAADGVAGLERATREAWDVILLDVMLPGLGGFDVCRDLRQRGSKTPIIMLTARDGLEDRVTGLNTGADDYLTKPFAFEELLARIHALLRRSDLARPVVLTAADLSLDPLSHRITRAGAPVVLTPKEYAILEFLMRHADQVVTRARLASAVWQDETDASGNLVDVHISRVRRKIDRDGEVPLIHTVRGRGYRLGPPEI